jgi:transcriptional regulator with GAF, ATPase, and Fis domain
MRLRDAARMVLVALLRVLLPEGERCYLCDVGITTLPLAQLNAVLALLGSVLRGTKTRSSDRFVLCTDSQGQIERYGLFALRRVEKESNMGGNDRLEPNARDELEQLLIRNALEQAHGDQVRAAKLLGISQTELLKRLKHYGLTTDELPEE